MPWGSWVWITLLHTFWGPACVALCCCMQHGWEGSIPFPYLIYSNYIQKREQGWDLWARDVQRAERMLPRDCGRVEESCFLMVLARQTVWFVSVIFCPVVFGFPSCQGREVVCICGEEWREGERGGETGNPLLCLPHGIRTCKLLDLEMIELSRFCQFRWRAVSKIYEVLALYTVVSWYRILKWNA